ncbi:MAG: hypothetical protein PHI31_17650, partial [Desulfuromonadaceae bacterium]|nr:hypothetical protein [Desulfuromonadaceae bacterium]
MKFPYNQPIPCHRLSIYLLAALLLYAAPVTADVRQDAEAAVSSLHQNASAQQFSDDMKSLGLVFEVARRYFLNNEKENSDRFYLLALQKSRVIDAMLKDSQIALAPGTSVLQPAPDQMVPVEV